jgi:branched-subunit amino acid transport protein
MEISSEFIWLLIGVSLATLIPRVLPMVLFSRINMPGWLLAFLRYVPIAVMTALLAQSVLTEDEAWIPVQDNLNLLALVPTLLAAVLTRSLLITVLTGIGAMFLLQWL